MGIKKYKNLPPGYGPAPRKYRWGKAGHCYWCGRNVKYTGNDQSNQATREHLIPKARMDEYHPMYRGNEMQVVACKRCNNARGHDMDWVPFHLKGEQV